MIDGCLARLLVKTWKCDTPDTLATFDDDIRHGCNAGGRVRRNCGSCRVRRYTSVSGRVRRARRVRAVVGASVPGRQEGHGRNYVRACRDIGIITIDALAVIAPWLSLIILGGRFRFSAIKKLLPQISAAVIARLIITPAVGMTLSYFLPRWLNLAPLSGADYAALFALFASPVAIASVAMADQMGSDSELAGQILVWTTLLRTALPKQGS